MHTKIWAELKNTKRSFKNENSQFLGFNFSFKIAYLYIHDKISSEAVALVTSMVVMTLVIYIYTVINDCDLYTYKMYVSFSLDWNK